jgi:hypothetical protein
MAGRGFLHEAEEIDASRIKVLRNGRWQSMYRPINCDREFSGVSLAESFAESYANKYDVDVGLICCADGGTTLEQWSQGGLLYDNAVSQAKLAKRTSILAGVLWHQGESDCSEELYPSYAERLKKFIKIIREDLDLKNVPFVMGGLGEYLSECTISKSVKNYFYINDAIKSVADSDEMIGFVSAVGLGSNPDKLHFNSKALYEFGIRYFNEFEKLRKKELFYENEVYECDVERTYIERL